MDRKPTYEELEQRVMELEKVALDRKKMKEELNVLLLVFEQDLHSIAILDPEGKVEYANTKLLDTYKISQDEVIGKHWGSFLSEDSDLRENIGEIRNTVLEKGKMWKGEISDVDAQGNRIWREARLFPIKNEAAELIHIVYMSEDTTERKKAQDALLEKHSFSTAVIERAAEGLCVCHEIEEYPYVRFTVWNDLMSEITGYTMEEINRLGWYQTVYPDPEVQTRAMERMAQMRQGVDLRNDEWEITRADGETRILNISTSVLETSDGVNHALALMHDLTQRKRAEEALRESQERYIALYNSPINLVFVSDDRGNFIDANDAALDLLGYKRNDIKTLNYFALLHPDQPVDHLVEAMDEMLRTGVQNKPLVIKLRTKEGEPIYIQSGGSLISGRKEIVGVAQNITNRMQAEEALRKSEAQYRTLIESANSIILKFDLNGNIRYLNPFGLEFFKYQKKEILGKPAIGTIVPETESTARNLVEMIKDIIKYPLRYKNNINQNIKSNGELVWISWTNESIKDAEGNMVEILSIGNDLTERIKAEEALKKEKKRFQILVEESPIGISLIRRDGRYEYLNPKFAQIFGYTPEDIPTGKEWFFKAYPDREYRHQVISKWISDQKEAKLGEARPRIFNVTVKTAQEKLFILNR